MNWFKRFILMVQFLTRIPISINLDIEQADFTWGIIFFPVVGLIVGLVMALGYYLGSLLGLNLIPFLLVITFQILITGALHIDGLGDTCDGFFSNKNREGMLTIMRDSRIGTNGSVAIFIDVLFKFVLLYELTRGINELTTLYIIIALPVAGKVGMLTATAKSTYARSDSGLGKLFIDDVGFWQWLFGIIFSLVIFYLFFSVYGIIYVCMILLVAYLFTVFAEKKIGGMTGDTLGAANEICEIAFLLFFTIIKSIAL